MITKESMTMESANSTTSNTLGMMKNLKVTIGEFLYFLPCQVVKQARFEVLLGHPFTVIAEAVTKDFQNGDQHITVYEPVTGAEQTIPTYACTRCPSLHMGF